MCWWSPWLDTPTVRITIDFDANYTEFDAQAK